MSGVPDRTFADAVGVQQLVVKQSGKSIQFLVRRLDRCQQIGEHADQTVADRVDADAALYRRPERVVTI